MKREDFQPGQLVRLISPYTFNGNQYFDGEHPTEGEVGIVSSAHLQRKRESPKIVCISWPQGAKWTDLDCIELEEQVSEEELQRTLESLGTPVAYEPLNTLNDVLTVLRIHERELLDAEASMRILKATLGIKPHTDFSLVLSEALRLATQQKIQPETLATLITTFPQEEE